MNTIFNMQHKLAILFDFCPLTTLDMSGKALERLTLTTFQTKTYQQYRESYCYYKTTCISLRSLFFTICRLVSPIRALSTQIIKKCGSRLIHVVSFYYQHVSRNKFATNRTSYCYYYCLVFLCVCKIFWTIVI